MNFKYQKDVRYNKKCFNAEWVRKHKTEASFLKVAEANGLTEAQAKELYGIAHEPKEVPTEPKEVPAKK